MFVPPHVCRVWCSQSCVYTQLSYLWRTKQSLDIIHYSVHSQGEKWNLSVIKSDFSIKVSPFLPDSSLLSTSNWNNINRTNIENCNQNQTRRESPENFQMKINNSKTYFNKLVHLISKT